MKIRKAQTGDLIRVDRFFKDLIQFNEGKLYRADWHFNQYPDLFLIQHHILEGNLYLLEDHNQLVGTLVLNQETSSGYDKASWTRLLNKEDYEVIHLLAVHPDYQKHGYGKILLEFAKEQARTRGRKQLRLDVYSRNVNSARFYLRNGFKLIDSVFQRYEKTNWKYSNFFELDLPD